MIIMFCQGKWE